jgi:hypothetical protein
MDISNLPTTVVTVDPAVLTEVPIAEIAEVPTAEVPTVTTDTTTRKAELAAKKAALMAEAKAIVAAERAEAKKARELAKAKVRAQEEALKETAKMLIELAVYVRRNYSRYLDQLEIEFTTFGDYIEISDIKVISESTSARQIELETLQSFSYYYNLPTSSRLRKAGFTTYDSILTNVIEEHICCYLPPNQDVRGKVIIEPTAAPANRVLVYLQNEPEAAPAFPDPNP